MQLDAKGATAKHVRPADHQVRYRSLGFIYGDERPPIQVQCDMEIKQKDGKKMQAVRR